MRDARFSSVYLRAPFGTGILDAQASTTGTYEQFRLTGVSETPPWMVPSGASLPLDTPVTSPDGLSFFQVQEEDGLIVRYNA
ncbi:MAG: hypothetical protein ABL986_24515 [Vicinamibacterales bacterium]